MSLFSFFMYCVQSLFFCKYCIIFSSYAEVKTVSPTLNCFLVYLFRRQHMFNWFKSTWVLSIAFLFQVQQLSIGIDLSGQDLTRSLKSGIKGIKGIKERINGDVSRFAEPQRHSWKVSSKVLRRFEGPQVYQPALLVFSLLNSSIEPLEFSSSEKADIIRTIALAVVQDNLATIQSF